MRTHSLALSPFPGDDCAIYVGGFANRTVTGVGVIDDWTDTAWVYRGVETGCAR